MKKTSNQQAQEAKGVGGGTKNTGDDHFTTPVAFCLEGEDILAPFPWWGKKHLQKHGREYRTKVCQRIFRYQRIQQRRKPVHAGKKRDHWQGADTIDQKRKGRIF